jgi:hypothetical protein
LFCPQINAIIALLVIAVLLIVILQLLPEDTGDAAAPTAAPP